MIQDLRRAWPEKLPETPAESPNNWKRMNQMDKVSAKIETISLLTYSEPPREEMPMFAENRVHQRTSGRPYPYQVVLSVDREHKQEKQYTLLSLENEYLRIEILPELGGRIYSAYDKTTGYDFLYKQHVIKPALIGVLGSWISGGMEFNWPFHHRASGYMPCDYRLEEKEDGSAVCWLSEHDPIDRMKGMVAVILRPHESIFETKMCLYNRTRDPHSFLWWENAAVPVNRNYQIFFPPDVSYVNFHYLKSRTTYPVAGNGIYNGIPMEEPRDISWHKNTHPATSYFAGASEYDFFGGYDHGKECGVVHIGDHHVSPGKKLFTWGYCQLAELWEKALTDADGQYAELMAGSYSDNQPNFSWLAPYETKQFSQYWYPISGVGAPTYANANCALRLERTGGGAVLTVQTTRVYPHAEVSVRCGEKTLFSAGQDFYPGRCASFRLSGIPEYVAIELTSSGEKIAEYAEKKFDRYNMPDVISDMPLAEEMQSADELYLAGVHTEQYRDPCVMPDVYWKEALKRNPRHTPSLLAMARYELMHCNDEEALRQIKKAEKYRCLFNTRLQSGEIYYVHGEILETMGREKEALDYYSKAAWAADCTAKAMTRIAMLEIREKEYAQALRHAQNALDYGTKNGAAAAAQILALRYLGRQEEADRIARERISFDPLDHLIRCLAGSGDFYSALNSDPAQTCLDLAADLDAMGQYGKIYSLLKGLILQKPGSAVVMICYALDYYAGLCGESTDGYLEKAKAAPLGSAYPHRAIERQILEKYAKQHDARAMFLLSCLLYDKRRYEEAAELLEQCGPDYMVFRNLAVACFSHLNRRGEALPLMEKALSLQPESEQLVYETAVLMDKLGVAPEKKAAFLEMHKLTRDDCLIESAKAYNQMFRPESALKILKGHTFVPCEGGEHAIADQYIFAYVSLGRAALRQNAAEQALGYFRQSQQMPLELGAGLWNPCKLVPCRYLEAVCLEKLGKTREAGEIFRSVTAAGVDYFSNMYLKELPYYQAKAYLHLNEPLRAQQLIIRYRREWSEIEGKRDNGFYSATPFFISFQDDPAEMRQAQSDYLMALCEDCMGNRVRAQQKLVHSIELNSENLFALSMKEYGFME